VIDKVRCLRVVFKKITPVQAILIKNSGPYHAGPYYSKRSKITPLRAGAIRANKVLLSMFAMKKTQGMFSTLAFIVKSYCLAAKYLCSPGKPSTR